MARISSFFFWRHLRAEPNQFILHYRNGRLIQSGAGLSFWFLPLSAAIAQAPVEDIETTFILKERSADFQDAAVQITLTYRCVQHEKAAQRVNFAISLEAGVWLEQPLERLASLWSQWAQGPARACLAALPIADAVQRGAEAVRAALDGALRGNAEIADMGLALVNLRVEQVRPTPELEKALQTPTREALQQKADEATFQRRALAVEKERAIKENELTTEIELARRQAELIRQESANQMLAMQSEAERQHFSVEAEIARGRLVAEGDAAKTTIEAEAAARAKRLLAEVEVDAEGQRLALWRDMPAGVIMGLAAQRFAEKVTAIEQLNLTPDLLREVLTQLAGGRESR